jgi:hypothetical protein
MPTDFDRWLAEQFADTGTFTALLVLLDVAEPRVTPVCSSYVNVIGDEIDWDEMTVLLQGAGVAWDAVAFFVEVADGGGALTSVEANRRLEVLAKAIEADRLHLNRGRLFDRLGRRLRVEEMLPS